MISPVAKAHPCSLMTPWETTPELHGRSLVSLHNPVLFSSTPSLSRISNPMRKNPKNELVRNDGKRSYWLLKTEPVEWSWDDQIRSDGGVSRWDGVRNRQAQKNLKSMKSGDLCFFYHSGRERRIIGVVEVARTWYSTADDRGDDWEGAVDVRTVAEMRRAVDLREIKAEEKEMKDFTLLRQPRLSVVPVPERVWNRICEMGGGFGDEDGVGEDEKD